MKNPWKRYSKINPQREDGNTQINRDVLEELIKINFTASDYKILFFIIRKTYGFNKTSDPISISQFQKGTNLSDRMVNKTIKKLKEHRIIFYQPSSIRGKQGSPINEFLFNKHHDTWLPIRVNHSSGVNQRVKIRVNHSSDTKDNTTKDNISTFLSDSIEVQLSELLFSLIKKNNPKAKQPNIQSWAKKIDLAIRIDERTKDELEKVIRWCQQDSFWSGNILSTQKLRVQFDQLWIKMSKNGNSKGGNKHGNFDSREYKGTDPKQLDWLND